MPQNVIVWFDLPTRDFDRAIGFYERILAGRINIQEMAGMKYAMFPMQGQMGVGGDLIPPDPAYQPAGAGAGARIYFDVSDRLDEALMLVEAAGGRIIRPKYLMEMAGWLAVVEDTEGNEVGLWSKA